jgi:hypothetical protein
MRFCHLEAARRDAVGGTLVLVRSRRGLRLYSSPTTLNRLRWTANPVSPP